MNVVPFLTSQSQWAVHTVFEGRYVGTVLALDERGAEIEARRQYGHLYESIEVRSQKK